MYAPPNFLNGGYSTQPTHLLHSFRKLVLFDNLEHLRTKVAQLLAELTPKIAASLTGYDFILNALSVANIF